MKDKSNIKFNVDSYDGHEGEGNFPKFGSLSELIDVAKSNLKFINDFSTEGNLSDLLNAKSKINNNQLENWLYSRQLSNNQKTMLQEHIFQRDSETNITIYIICLGQTGQDLQDTLESITQNNYPGLNLHPVIVSNDFMNSEHSRWISVEGDNYAKKINSDIKSHDFDWLMIVRAGSLLTESGAVQLNLNLIDAGECVAVYCDEIYQKNNRLIGTAFRPDFNLDLLLSNPSDMARHWLFKRESVLNTDGFDESYLYAWEFSLIIHFIEKYGINRIGHLPEPLIISNSLPRETQSEYATIIKNHVINRGYINAEISSFHPGIYSVDYNHHIQPLVSIIIPTKDQLPVLISCVTSLLERTNYKNYELIIVDNDSETLEAKQWLDGISKVDPQRIKVLRYPYPFNYSAINNYAVSEARGEYLILLNNDTAIINSNWLDNLVNHAIRPEVGIVGSKLLYPDGRIQHAGVILGLRGPADHPFIGDLSNDVGYMHRLNCDQSYTAVTAACLMIRKSIYDEVGGLDEDNFRVSYNDVDLCMKVHQAGYMTIWTPRSIVMHEGSVSQKKVDKATFEKKRERFINEQNFFYEKWLPFIANDPSYNKNLSLNGSGFFLDPDAKWGTVSWKKLPIIMAFNADGLESGRTRIISPIMTSSDNALIEGHFMSHAQNLSDIARRSPDSVLLQRPFNLQWQEWLERLHLFPNVFKVIDIDTNLTALHKTHPLRQHLPNNILKSMRHSIELVDRLIVSNDSLADRFSRLHKDIQVVQSKLSPNVWGGLTNEQSNNEVLRIGWMGDSGDEANLDIIFEVVKNFSKKVSWVFYGFCPDKFKPYVHEVYNQVTPSRHAEKLLSLKLDLALLPLEDSEFNKISSNNKILEFGACGIPVICSDVIKDHHTLPVEYTKNRYKNWLDAIDGHIIGSCDLVRVGNDLREKVLKDWLLTEQDLVSWTKAWLPN